ncbi:acyltransferase [Dyadobacter sp. CY326]|uniref:acyltransferase family protein n=1 Tax=Dyadobacter sp. CY326 TaxID=2907300 RepID=UPI001F28B99A|nr:acyltransferase [Dyadobacter sp. CY326]MCE7066590.1 acyltransferase [Dyadobacter sp. CY326]
MNKTLNQNPASGFVRNNTLDFIRACAVLLVILNHLYPLVSAKSDPMIKKLVGFGFYVINTGGWIGVDLFFVLSGFLVSGLLFKEHHLSGKIDAARFLIRRGFKIYPSFIALLLITFILERTFLKSDFSFANAAYLKDLFFVHNYLGGRWAHTWSLDVEEGFYFLLTAMFLICIRFKKLTLKTLVITYLTLLISGIAFRLAANIQHPQYDFLMHFGKTHFRLDSLLLGVILSYLLNYRKEALGSFISTHQKWMLPVAALLLSLNFLLPYWEYNIVSVVFLSTNAACFGVLLMAALYKKEHVAIFNNRTISFIGQNSYCIYLWHVPVNVYLLLAFKKAGIATPFTSVPQWLLYAACYIGLSLAAGIIFTEIIEKPFLKIRETFFQSKSSPRAIEPVIENQVALELNKHLA